MTIRLQDTKEFYHDEADVALENCQTAGYQAAFMPQLADVRINGQASWNKKFSTPSIRATGRTKQGNTVVVYAHVPTSITTPEAIRQKNSLLSERQRIYGHNKVHLPQEEFQTLVDQDGKTDDHGNRLIWVIDHDVLVRANFGDVPIAEALEHPQTIPFLGGQERAERYLKEHARAYVTKEICVWYYKDLENDPPLAHLLKLGCNRCEGLVGADSFGGSLRFLGIKNLRSAISDEGQWYKIRVGTTTTVEGSQEEREVPIIIKADSLARVKLYGEALRGFYGYGGWLKEIEVVKDGPLDPNKSISLVGEDFGKSLAKVGFDRKSIENHIAGIRAGIKREIAEAEGSISKLEVFLKEI